ncbi:hypothetical protein INT47_011139 [Mucor saturninus]|uniref:Retrotransposon gag domain-containing protein n=1 Tax=Mucor saturninus TaxID=64648 RepID=A0A8H7RDJ7_9FUNG|nr:hypothetical protein INT47_011139 [Mucor saturninus]
MRSALTLAQDEMHSLTMYIASAPESDILLRNKRTRLARRLEDIELFKQSLTMMEATAGDTILASKISSVVPRNLPKFCWEGHNHVEGAPVFIDIKTCLRNFTDVLRSYNIDFDANYLRIMPPQLSDPARGWFEDYLTTFRKVKQADPTWHEFVVAFQERYGLNAQEERNNSARELNNITMLRGETLDDFIDRFNNLRRRAVGQILPDSVLAEKFLAALPDNLAEQVTIASVSPSEYKQSDVDILSSLARALLNRLSKGKGRASASECAPRAPKRTSSDSDQSNI